MPRSIRVLVAGVALVLTSFAACKKPATEHPPEFMGRKVFLDRVLDTRCSGATEYDFAGGVGRYSLMHCTDAPTKARVSVMSVRLDDDRLDPDQRELVEWINIEGSVSFATNASPPLTGGEVLGLLATYGQHYLTPAGARKLAHYIDTWPVPTGPHMGTKYHALDRTFITSNYTYWPSPPSNPECPPRVEWEVKLERRHAKNEALLEGVVPHSP